MGILKTINNLKIAAANTRMTNMVSFGSIEAYENKATIRYPYINLDVVGANVVGNSKTYNIRCYVCDRNVPYTAYNKCEVILDELLKSNWIYLSQYTVNYFTMNFKDGVNGVWSDIQIEVPIETQCDIEPNLDITNFILNENGDLIRLDDPIDGYIQQEEINQLKYDK